MNPLQILSGIAGTIGQVGGSGALGNTAGMLEGEQLKRQYASQDLNDRMKMLKILQETQQMQQPVGFGPGTRVWDPVQGKFIDTVPFAPRPMMNLGPGHTAHDPSGVRPDFTAPPLPVAPKDPTPTLILGQIEEKVRTGGVESLSPGEKLLFDRAAKATKTQDALHMYLEKVNPQSPEEMLKAVQEFRAKGGTDKPVTPYPGSPQRPHFDVRVQPGPDGKAHLYEYRRVTEPNGDTTVKRLDRGLAYPPPSVIGQQPQETTTTGEKITPRREIKAGSDDFKAINRSLPNLVNEIGAQFQAKGTNFNVPGPYVTLPSGRRVRKEDVISKAMKERFGVEVGVRWNGKEFEAVQAWHPAVKEQTSSTRTRGPAGSGAGAITRPPGPRVTDAEAVTEESDAEGE